jgi:hypothetical protein
MVMKIIDWSKKWEKLGRITKNGHRLFKENSTGRFAIADNSGDWPDTTEDGVLYVDGSRPITSYVVGDHVSYTVPLFHPSGEKTYTGTDLRGALRVCEVCGNKLAPVEEIRELMLAVVEGRVALNG